ncbi:porin family protein [Sanyastnella coralliicola]|uniref:porin family protein n=1 Tax=Sanyastnella coralliicola TaxID=3069118 RepID=UPI0027BAB00C|nr:porin family protein [Longitalea sp. SCSIO 12813]
MRLTTFIICLLAPMIIFGQTERKKGPIEIINPPVSQDRFIFELHNDMFLEIPGNMDIRPWSPGVNAHIMYDYPLGKSVMSFAWGYGFSSFNLHTNGEFERDGLSPDEFVRFYPFPENYEYKKNKVSANFLEIPIEFRLRTRGDRPFKMSVGGKVGYLVNIHTKTRDDDGKRKFYQVPEINRWRYGVVGRIGIGRWSLFSFYSVSTFLLPDKGVELNPLTIGLSIALI